MKLANGVLVQRPRDLPDLAGDTLYCDFETTSFDPKVAAVDPWAGHRIAGAAVAVDDSPVYYVPMRHASSDNLQLDVALAWLRDVMRQTSTWANHNVKFDAHMADADGIEYGGGLLCTMTGAKIVDSDRMRYGLDALGTSWLGRGKKDDRVDAWLRAAKSKNYGDVPADIMAEYGCEDVLLTRDLHRYVEANIPDQCRGVWETEKKLTSVLLDMEREGMRVIPQELKAQELRSRIKLIGLEEEVADLLGVDVNPASNKDCYEALVVANGLPVLSRTEEGNPSFDADALKSYLQHPDVVADERLSSGVKKMLEYREESTLLSLFIMPYQLLGHDGKIHPFYNQTVRTGRMSCSKPNAQQLSKRAKGFIHPDDEDSAFLSNDYSQVEFRIIVHYVRDPAAIAAYADDPDTDFHSWVAKMCGIDRRPAKNVNFAIAFGGGRERVTKMLAGDMSLMADVTARIDAAINKGDVRPSQRHVVFRSMYTRRGEEVYEAHHATIPGIRRATLSASRNVERRGYVFNLYGRRRHLPVRASYRGFNTVVQSSAADLMKERLVATSPRFNPWVRDLGITQRAVVHDEVLFHGPREVTRDARVIARLTAELERVSVNLLVPIRSVAAWSDKSWRDVSEVPVDRAQAGL